MRCRTGIKGYVGEIASEYGGGFWWTRGRRTDGGVLSCGPTAVRLSTWVTHVAKLFFFLFLFSLFFQIPNPKQTRRCDKRGFIGRYVMFELAILGRSKRRGGRGGGSWRIMGACNQENVCLVHHMCHKYVPICNFSRMNSQPLN